MIATVHDLRLRLARGHGRPALVRNLGDMVTYGELLRQAEAVAAHLGAERKLVFLEAGNTIEAIAAYLGCLLGSHPVYLFASHEAAILSDLVARYRPDVIVRPAMAEPFAWQGRDKPRTFHPDLAVLLSTSGTTGSPKFVKLSLGNILANADAIADYLYITEDDRALTSLPMQYSYGLSVVNSHLFAGASLLLNDASVTDATFFETLRMGGGTSFAGVPYTFEVLRIADSSWAEIPSLRYVTQAGGHLAPQRVQHFAELGKVHGWRFHVMYGQTECAPRIAHLPPDLAASFPDCVGVAIPGGSIQLFDEQGDVIESANVAGEMVYSGPNVMLGYAEGYYDLATGTPPAPHRTGDIACRNPEGLYYIVGRKSRFVKPYGLRINLDEFQRELQGVHSEVVCAGSDDVIVIAKAGADRSIDARMLDFAQQRLGLPAIFFKIVHPPEIPLLSNQKIDFQAILAFAHYRPDEPPKSGALATIFSARFVKQVLVEASQILGITDPQWQNVRHIYAKLLNLSVVDGRSSFVMLAGDSLSYVQISIALEQYLGHLPAGWENCTVNELEEVGTVEHAF